MEKVTFLIELKDKITTGLERVQSAFSSLNRETERTKSTTERFGDVCRKLDWSKWQAMADLAQRVGDELAAATTGGMTFGQSMADLSAITGICGDELERLSARARQVGTDSGQGADNAARAYSLLASQIEVAEIGMEGLDTLLEKSVTLAQASGMSLDAAADALAGTVNQFGLGADQAERVINVLAAGSKYGAAEIEHLTQSFKVTGAAASAMGLSVEETAGALEILSQANLKGSEAGTALRNIILKLNTELGIDLSQTSLGTALDALKPKLTDAAYLSRVFGMENIAAAQFLIQNAAAVDEMTARLTDTNTAQEQAAIRTETSAHQMEVLRARVDDIKIAIADFLGNGAPLLTFLTENAGVLSLLVDLGPKVKAVLGMISIQTVKSTASLVAHKAATLAVTAATRTWSVVQQALNLILTANPIGIAIAAIGALTAAVVYCYNHFEGFRRMCDTVWTAVKEVATAVWDYLVRAFERASAVIREAWLWVKNFFGITDAQSAVAAGAAIGGLAQAIDTETQAIQANTDARKKNKAVSLDFALPATTGAPASVTPVAKADLKPLYTDLQGIGEAIGSEVPQRIELPLELTVKGRVDAHLDEVTAALERQQARAQATQQGLSAIGNTFGSLGQMASGAAADVLQWGAGVIQAISQAIPQIAALVTAKKAEATANAEAAATGAASAVASIPWVGPAMAVAAVASIMAALANIPKFANGALAYGPTLGLFGEYPGASNNPEVVAPLSRLKGMLGDAVAEGPAGDITFRIDGYDLVALYNKHTRRKHRTT